MWNGRASPARPILKPVISKNVDSNHTNTDSRIKKGHPLGLRYSGALVSLNWLTKLALA